MWGAPVYLLRYYGEALSTLVLGRPLQVLTESSLLLMKWGICKYTLCIWMIFLTDTSSDTIETLMIYSKTTRFLIFRLGAYHDGESEASSCSSSSGFIMSYTRDDSFKFSRFSECSIRSFQNFLRMDRSSCLMQRSSKESLQFPTTFPGKYMTLHEQCRRFTGGPPCEVRWILIK